ncbi:acyl-CoA thioesterase [Metabacillus niabensis]|uniref:acyl-CoA thioesterase n=1 Tax=Metabacillus niabensis TaxID=324854 RepID=UPI001CFBA69E|nr:thioesterase family protein [Metabacillus niabensis]
MRKSEYQFSVTWGDTDAAGIVFYPNFYKWMDTATHHLFSRIGYPTSELFTVKKIGLPLIKTTCDFKQPLFFEDNVTIHSEIKEIHSKVFLVEHTFHKGHDIIAIGTELRAWGDLSDKKPKAVVIPNEVRQLLEHE